MSGRRSRVEVTELIRVLDTQSGVQLGHLLDIGYSSLCFFSSEGFIELQALNLRLVASDIDTTLQYIDVTGRVLWSREIPGKGYWNTAVKVEKPCAKSASRMAHLTQRFAEE